MKNNGKTTAPVVCEHPVDGLDVHSFDGDGYVRAVTYGAWRVAFLNHAEMFASPTYIERHRETDESFVLLEGEAVLLVGEEKLPVSMIRNRIYNVRKNVWHQILTKPGTRCLVVENADTSVENSEKRPVVQARRKGFDFFSAPIVV